MDMGNKFVAVGLAAIFALAAGVALGDSNHGAVIKRSDLLEEATSNNPSLVAARYEADAAKLMIRPAGALPDPMVELGIMSVPVNNFSLTDEDMTQKFITVTQAFPFPGKLRLAMNAAGSDADARKSLVKVYEDQLRFEITKIFNELVFKVESIGVVEHHVGLLKQYSEIAATTYSVGRGNQWDVFSAQVQMAKLMERVRNLESDISGMRAMLAGLVGRDSGPIEGHPEIEWTPLLELDENDLIARSEQHNATLLYTAALVKKSESEARLANRDRYPNFSLSLSYGQRSAGTMNGETVERPDLLSAMVGIEVPLYASRKQIPMAKSAETMTLSNRAMYEEKRIMIAARIREKVAAIRKADEVAELYRTGIIPQASSMVQSALANYRVGKVDFMTLITSELDQMDMELMYYETRIERETDIAELELLVGEQIR